MFFAFVCLLFDIRLSQNPFSFKCNLLIEESAPLPIDILLLFLGLHKKVNPILVWTASISN